MSTKLGGARRLPTRHRRLGALFAVLLSTAAVPEVCAVEGTLRALSDYVYRSYSKSADEPVWQAQAWHLLPAGGFAGLGASRVNLGRADLELAPYVGMSFAPAVDWRVIGNLVGYLYEHTSGNSPGHYAEPSLTVQFRDAATFKAGVALDLYGFGESVPYLETAARYPLTDITNVSGTIGYEHVRALSGDDYGYWNLGVTHYLTPRWALDLRYHGARGVNHGGAGTRHGFMERMEIGDRIVLGVSFGF